MELENAVNQAHKELSQRYDFKGVDASLKQTGETIVMEANTEERVKAVLDVLQSKLVKRGISLKSLDLGEPVLSGKIYRMSGASVWEQVACRRMTPQPFISSKRSLRRWRRSASS